MKKTQDLMQLKEKLSLMVVHEIKDVLLIGRGDMNVVILSEILAEAIAYRNKCSQVFQPETTTPEVILKVAIRISKKPLSTGPHLCRPNYTIVLDDSFLKILNVTEGLKRSGILLVNSSYSPFELIELFGIGFSTATVDVDKVTINEIDESLTNQNYGGNNYIGILGAFCRISGEVSLEALNQAVLGFYPESIARKSIRSMRKAFRTVKIV